MTRVESIQLTLDRKTRRWWFIVDVILLQFLIPPYASRGFAWDKWGDIIYYTLGHALFFSFTELFPVFQVWVILLMVLLVWSRSRVTRVFSAYAGVSYVLFAILQSIAVTPKHGLSIVTINLVLFLVVAGTWFLEAVVGQNDFAKRGQSLWRYAVIPPAFLAFWLPIDWTTGEPDFNPVYLITSGSALAFCTMTPVYLAVLIFFYPCVNMLTLRVTGIVGTLVGLYNVIPKLVFGIGASWWACALHVPLLVLSIVGLILSMSRRQRSRVKNAVVTGDSRRQE